MTANETAVRELLAAGRAAAEDWLKQIDQLEAAVNGTAVVTPPRGHRAAAAKERAELVYEYLVERGEKVSGPEVRAALDLTPVEFSRTVVRLEGEGRVERTGKQQWSRYEARVATPPTPEFSAYQGSLPGRLLETIEAQGFATVSDLADALGVGTEVVAETCQTLLGEREIRAEVRAGSHGYVREEGV